MSKKVAVTGMSGLVGTRFGQLFGDDYDFCNMDLLVGVDITNYENVKGFLKKNKVDSVIHLAAFTNVSAAHEQDGNKNGSCYRVNVTGTKNIAQACNQLGKYLVHVSTDYVFDGAKKSAYTEEDEVNPIEWYGQTKYWAEQEVGEATRDFSIFRIAYPYQANPMRADLVANIKEKLLSNSLPPAFTDHVITPVFVDDLCGVFDYAIRNRPKGIYHAVGSSWHSDYEIANMVNNIFELDEEVEKGSLKEYLKKVKRPYQKNMMVSNAKLKTDFGVNMKTFEEGLFEIKSQLA